MGVIGITLKKTTSKVKTREELVPHIVQGRVRAGQVEANVLTGTGSVVFIDKATKVTYYIQRPTLLALLPKIKELWKDMGLY